MLALDWPLRPRSTGRWIRIRQGLLPAFTAKRIMPRHPFLSRIEAALIRWLIGSPRIGAILVKQRGEPVTWILRDHGDPSNFAGDDDFEEPASMQLERLYHAPDAQR